MKKLLLVILLLFFAFFSSILASDYIYFYGDGNFDSNETEDYLVAHGVYENYELMKYDIYFNDDAWEYFLQKIQDYNIPSAKWEMPMLIVEDKGYAKIFVGKEQVKSYFKNNYTYSYLKKEKIPTIEEMDYKKLSGKQKKTAQFVVAKIEELFQQKSKGNIYSKIKLYESTFVYLENLLENKKNLEKKMLIYYVKINMVIEYLQLIKKI